jgi:hypothetical protein
MLCKKGSILHMNDTNRRPVPRGVLLIAAFYLFGAAVLLVSLFTNPVDVSTTIAAAHGLSPAAGTWILPAAAGLAILIAYGLLTGSRWGFFLTVAYALIFGTISFWLLLQNFEQPYIGNATWSFVVLLYLIARRQALLHR